MSHIAGEPELPRTEGLRWGSIGGCPSNAYAHNSLAAVCEGRLAAGGHPRTSAPDCRTVREGSLAPEPSCARPAFRVGQEASPARFMADIRAGRRR